MSHLGSSAAHSSVVPECLPGVQWAARLAAGTCLFSHPSSGEITFSWVIREAFFLNMCTRDAKYLLGKGQAKWIPPGVEENGVCEDYCVSGVNTVVIRQSRVVTCTETWCCCHRCSVPFGRLSGNMGVCQWTWRWGLTERGEYTVIKMKIFASYSA